MKIFIKERISDNFGDSINEVMRIMGIVSKREKSDSIIVFDFSKSLFSNPFLLVALHLLAKRYVKEGLEVSYTWPKGNQGYSEYLHLVNYPNTLKAAEFSENDFDSLMQGYLNKTYIPLTSFTTSKQEKLTLSREKTLSTLNRILAIQCNLTGNIKSAIIYLIDEAINNILDHSLTDTGVLFAQYYPSKNYMDVCIGDDGIGILQSYKRRNIESIDSDKEALLRAVNGLSTKDNPDSRGFGISTSKKMLVEGLRGKYFLYSGRAAFIDTLETKNIVEVSEDLNWYGAILFMRIPFVPIADFNYINYIDSRN